jgi:hypothetical protein
MSIILSIVALFLSLSIFSLVLFDTNFRRGYNFSRNMRKNAKEHTTMSTYNTANIPLSWYNTVFAHRLDLFADTEWGINHALSAALIGTDVVLMVNLRDFQMFSDGVYKLLIEDPFGCEWTESFPIERDFVERNLDKLIRVEAQILDARTKDGVLRFKKNKYYTNLLVPYKVSETGVFTELFTSELFDKRYENEKR